MWRDLHKDGLALPGERVSRSTVTNVQRSVAKLATIGFLTVTTAIPRGEDEPFDGSSQTHPHSGARPPLCVRAAGLRGHGKRPLLRRARACRGLDSGGAEAPQVHARHLPSASVHRRLEHGAHLPGGVAGPVRRTMGHPRARNRYEKVPQRRKNARVPASSVAAAQNETASLTPPPPTPTSTSEPGPGEPSHPGTGPRPGAGRRPGTAGTLAPATAVPRPPASGRGGDRLPLPTPHPHGGRNGLPGIGGGGRGRGRAARPVPPQARDRPVRAAGCSGSPGRAPPTPRE